MDYLNWRPAFYTPTFTTEIHNGNLIIRGSKKPKRQLSLIVDNTKRDTVNVK